MYIYLSERLANPTDCQRARKKTMVVLKISFFRLDRTLYNITMRTLFTRACFALYNIIILCDIPTHGLSKEQSAVLGQRRYLCDLFFPVFL